MINIIKRISDKYFFYIVSLLFGLCFLFEHPHGDDLGLAYVADNSLKGIFNGVIDIIEKRGLLSFTGVLFVTFNNLPRIFFVLFMAITMFVILCSIKYLITNDKKKNIGLEIFICLAVSSYTYVDMQSAGWVVTTCCYLVPEALLFISLIPIKKINENSSLTLFEKIVFLIVLFFASQTSQVMAFLLVCYFFELIYCVYKKKNWKYIFICLIVIVSFAYLTMVSDVNIDRIPIETAKRMPMIGMYNIINKLDIGLFSTFGWLYFGDNFFIYLTFITLLLLTLKTDKSKVIKIFSFLPIILSFSLKKLYTSNKSINAFEITAKELGSSNFGLFNFDSINNINTYIMYFAICLITIITLIQILYLAETKKEIFNIFTILIAGFGSRLALMLTPNIFASQQRTFIFLDFAIILVLIYLYSIKEKEIKTRTYSLLIVVYKGLCCVLLMYFFAYVYNYGGSSLFDLLR